MSFGSGWSMVSSGPNLPYDQGTQCVQLLPVRCTCACSEGSVILHILGFHRSHRGGNGKLSPYDGFQARWKGSRLLVFPVFSPLPRRGVPQPGRNLTERSCSGVFSILASP